MLYQYFSTGVDISLECRSIRFLFFIYSGFPSSLMLFLVEVMKVTFLVSVLLELGGHPGILLVSVLV